MEEEGAGSFHAGLLEYPRDGNHLVVVYPDEILCPCMTLDCAREAAVDPPVGIPVLWFEAAVCLKVMKKGPYNLVRKAVVEGIHIFL